MILETYAFSSSTVADKQLFSWSTYTYNMREARSSHLVYYCRVLLQLKMEVAPICIYIRACSYMTSLQNLYTPLPCCSLWCYSTTYYACCLKVGICFSNGRIPCVSLVPRPPGKKEKKTGLVSTVCAHKTIPRESTYVWK